MLVKLLLPFLRKLLQSPSSWLPDLFKAAAEGKLGPKVKAAYDFAAGKKTYTGLALIAAAYALRAAAANGLLPEGEQYAGYVEAAGLFLVGVGLVDGAVRAPAPKSSGDLSKLSYDDRAKLGL